MVLFPAHPLTILYIFMKFSENPFYVLKEGSCCFKCIVILLVYFLNCQSALLRENK